MITLYKRQHSSQCLADIEKRIAQGKLKPPADRGKFLAQYKGCRCPWWARGTNKFRQPIPKQSTGCDLLADAEMVRQKLYNADLNRNEPEPKAKALSLQQALEKWDERKLKGTPANPRPETTRGNYRFAAGELIAFLQKGEERPVYFDEVTPSVLYDLQAHWAARGVAGTSNNQYRVCLHAFYSHAIKTEDAKTRDGQLILMNPIKKLDRLPEEKEPTLPLDPEEGDANWRLVRREIVGFIEGQKPKRARTIRKHPENFLALLEVMYSTGLRISDAAKFVPSRIVQTPFGNFKYVAKQTKTGRPVTCFLPVWLAEKLRALPAVAEGYPFWDGVSDLRAYIGHEVRAPLFELGEKLGIHDQVYEVEGKSVQDTLRPHRFRDSFAVNQILAGCDIRELAKKLGHKSVQTTEDHYLPWIRKREQQMELNHYRLERDRGGDNVIEIAGRKAAG
jgi:integrase